VEGAASDLVTLWVPLGDCPVATGGLVYLDGSHQESDISERIRNVAPNDRADGR